MNKLWKRLFRRGKPGFSANRTWEEMDDKSLACRRLAGCRGESRTYSTPADNPRSNNLCSWAYHRPLWKSTGRPIKTRLPVVSKMWITVYKQVILVNQIAG